MARMEPYKYIFVYFSFVIICPNPIECNRLISKETYLIKMMCKLSFKGHFTYHIS